jgi:hypothetical protein
VGSLLGPDTRPLASAPTNSVQLATAAANSVGIWNRNIVGSKDENGTKIFRTDRFRFLYYGSVFKHKKLSVLIGFTTIFNHFLYSLIAKM